MRARKLIATVAALVAALAAPVQAGEIEDAFRGFIDRLRGQGRTILESAQGRGWQEARTPVLEPRVDELPLGHGQHVLFVAPGCRSCDEAQKYFSQRRWKVEVLDLSRSGTAREAYALAQGHGLPLVLIGKHRLTGWNLRLLKEAVVRDTMDKVPSGSGA